MDAPRISILMPVHNAAATLETAVESIRHQDTNDWEMVMVDDGSTDESPAIMESYARRDPRIRCLFRSRCGIVEALSAAAEAAQGTLLARMDADDIALPERLRTQTDALLQAPGAVLCGARVRIFGEQMGSGIRRYENWINALVTHEAMEREMFVECPVPHPTFLMTRDAFDAVGGYRDCGWPEDYDLVLRLRRMGGQFVKPEPVLLHWRNHPARLSMTDERYGEKAFRALKRHFLGAMYHADAAMPFYQWGAGEVGKRWLREWPVPPVAVVDINPRKIGRIIHGTPVVPQEALPPPGQCMVLIAVGTPGAREEIRERLRPKNYCEPAHFRFIA